MNVNVNRSGEEEQNEKNLDHVACCVGFCVGNG